MEPSASRSSLKQEIKDEFGDITDSDVDDEHTRQEVNRHRGTIEEHDRRKTQSMLVRAKEYSDSKETIAGLVRELSDLKAKHQADAEQKAATDLECHKLRIELQNYRTQFDAAQRQASQLSIRLADTEDQRDELRSTLELRVVAQKRRQRAARQMLEWAEGKARENFEYAIFATLHALIVDPVMRPPHISRMKPQEQPVAHEAQEQIERGNICLGEVRARQLLQNHALHLAHTHFDSTRSSTPRRAASVGSGGRRSQTATHGPRPWYPPGPTHSAANNLPEMRRSSKSPSASPRRQFGPASDYSATLNNMQHLLDQLSSWSAGHSP
jgi:regulator of replication initiation timing